MPRHPDAAWPDPAEKRQLWALDVRLPEGSPLIRIARGERGRYREECRAGYLICPLPDCDDRRLIARGGEYLHDHFAHKPGAGGHGPESVAHWAAKHLLGRWLRTQPGVSDVRVDDATIETGQRPDVLGRLADGRQIALEIQYATLSAEAWIERRARYEQGGIVQVWLWGAPGRWLGAIGEQGRVSRYPRMLDAANDSGYPVRWFDPGMATVLAPRREWMTPEFFYRGVASAPLAEVKLVDGILVAPFDGDLHLNYPAAPRVIGAAPPRITGAAPRGTIYGAAVRIREAAPLPPLPDPPPARNCAADDIWWNYYAARAELMARVWDAVCVDLPEDRLVAAQARYWHAVVLERIIVGHVGGTIGVATIAAITKRGGARSLEDAMTAARAFAGSLVTLGYLAPTGPDTFEILADREAGQLEEEALRELRASRGRVTRQPGLFD